MGVVGNGGSHAMFGPILRQIPGLEVTALLEADRSFARGWMPYLGKIPLYEEIESFLSEVPMECVFFASSASVPFAIAAANAGKHILCVNPFTLDLLESGAIYRVVAEQGVLYMPFFTKPFNPEFMEATQWVAAGELGRLTSVHCEWGFNRSEDTGRSELSGWHPLFAAHASQTIGLCRRWLGEVETVSADVDVHCPARRSGERAHFILNHARGISVHHLACVNGHRQMERYLLQGTKGVLEIERALGTRNGTLNSYRLAIHRNGKSLEIVRPGGPEHMAKLSVDMAARSVVEEFLHCVRTGTRPCVDLQDTRKVTEVIAATYLSSLEKAKIVLPLRDPSALSRVLSKRAVK